MRFKKHLAQAILEGMLEHVTTEPNAVSSGDKDLLKGIINLFRQAEHFENLLSVLSEMIREMVIKSLGSSFKYVRYHVRCKIYHKASFEFSGS